MAVSSLTEPPPGAWGTHAEPPYDVQRLNPSASAVASAEPIAQPVGVMLSPRRTRLLAVLGTIALIAAFSAGFLVGYFIRI